MHQGSNRSQTEQINMFDLLLGIKRNKSLEKAVPREINTKKMHDVNPLLEECVWSWLYKANHRNSDGFTTMGVCEEGLFLRSDAPT